MSADLALDRRGHGEPLLLLHGLGHHRHAWKRIVPLLSDRFDVITVDLPGFAESVHVPGAPRKVPDIARFIADRFDSWDVDSRPHVVGHSLGGAIALELASDGHARSVTAFEPSRLPRAVQPFSRRSGCSRPCACPGSRSLWRGSTPQPNASSDGDSMRSASTSSH